jgi:hypothetical protein
MLEKPNASRCAKAGSPPWLLTFTFTLNCPLLAALCPGRWPALNANIFCAFVGPLLLPLWEEAALEFGGVPEYSSEWLGVNSDWAWWCCCCPCPCP